MGFRKEVLDQIPQTAPWRGGPNADFADVLGPLLGQRELVARTWFAQLRTPPNPKQPQWGQSPTAAQDIRATMQIFDPQTPAKTIDDAVAKVETATAGPNMEAPARAANYESIGALLLAHDRKEQAAKYYQKCVDVVYEKDQAESAEICYPRCVQAADLWAELGKWDQAAADYAAAAKAGPSTVPLAPPAPRRRRASAGCGA